MKLETAQREILPDSVTTILRQAIIKGDIKPGEKLVQADIAKQLDVSRMPVREALKTLEMEGLVTIQPHKGAVVNKLTVEDMDEIYEIRTFLEPLTLKKSVPHLKGEDFKNLKKLHRMMNAVTSTEEYVELNKRFHDLSLSGCESQRLHSLMARISHGIAKETPYIIPHQMEKSNKEHAIILQAILDGDAARAQVEMAKHIDRTRKDLIALLKER